MIRSTIFGKRISLYQAFQKMNKTVRISIFVFLFCRLITNAFAENTEAIENAETIENLQVRAMQRVGQKIRLNMYNFFMSDQPGFKQRIALLNDKNPKIDMSPGEIVKTDRDLDVAITGNGFFMLNDENLSEIVYSRCGSLGINPDGELCLISGSIVRRLEPTIVIPTEVHTVQINDDGGVWVVMNGDIQGLQMIGQIELATFRDPSRLAPVDDLCFAETKESGPPSAEWPGINETGALKSGYLEQSNIRMEALLEELRRLRVIQRSLSAP